MITLGTPTVLCCDFPGCSASLPVLTSVELARRDAAVAGDRLELAVVRLQLGWVRRSGPGGEDLCPEHAPCAERPVVRVHGLVDHLVVDAERLSLANDEERLTGIEVRALHDGRWGVHDLTVLSRESLLRWLRSRGTRSDWAENTVGILLGHGPLTDGVSP